MTAKRFRPSRGGPGGSDVRYRQVEAAVRDVRRRLPAPLREAGDRIPVTAMPRPTPEMERDGIAPDTLGLFEGSPFPDTEDGGLNLPAHILLFVDNLWSFSDRDPRIFREEVQRTYLHELGHFLGLDEGDLELRDLL